MDGFNLLPVPRPLFASSMSTGLFLDPYQVCECECGLFLDLSALVFHECNHGVWKQTLLTAKWCSLQQQHTWTFMACIALPLTTLSSLKVLLELLSLGYCSGIKNWQDTDTLWLTPLGRSAWGPQLCARQVLVQGICSQAPAMGVYLWSGAIREMERQIQLFFSSWNIFLLCLTILSEVSLHSDFKFRQIRHWLLKRSVHCKTRLSCSDTPSHLLQHAQPCF